MTPPYQQRAAGEASFYLSEALVGTRRLLGLLDREPFSASAGSFDRDHWAWKFRDFPMGMLQSGTYPLALLWKHELPDNPYFGNDRVAEWIELALDATLRHQHPNGSFDAFAPYEQDVGSTLGMAHGASEALRLMGDALSAPLVARLRDALRRACDFSLRRDEEHAFVSNHRGLFALALLNAAELLGEDAYRRRAEDLTTSIVDEQSPEGWYREYEGADPGYESLGIFHLAVYWRRTRSDRVLTSLARSVEFYGHFVHPDGSVGGVYGSRQTGLYVPAGFEILSHHVPGAAAVARFMRDRLPNGSVPTPSSIDLHNLPMLTYAYAEAALAVRPQATAPAPEPLPCEALDGVKHFPHAGLAVAAAREYYAVTSISRGGVLNVFDRTHGRLLHQDAGYGARVGRRRWSSQISGFGHALESTDPATISVRTTFGDAGQQLPTPATFLLLRILNLTAFRSLTLGSWLRKHIVRRLVLPKRPGPLTLTRRIAFGEAAVTVTDLLEAKTGTRVDAVGLLRTFTAGHMGSARYFHPSELTPGAGPDTSHLAAELTRNGTARVEHSIDCRRTRSIEGMDRAAGSLLEMARRR